jgi:hypothetical protein
MEGIKEISKNEIKRFRYGHINEGL